MMLNSTNTLSTTKKCNKCHQIQSITEFSTYKKDRWTCICSYCKSCMRARARVYSKEYRKTKPIQTTQATKEWRKKNRDKVNKQSREWVKQNPELRAVIAANDQARRRASLKETDIDSKWLMMLRADTEFCVICDHQMNSIDPKSTHYKTLDHILPLIVGGRHSKANVRYVCASCNFKRPRNGLDVGGEVH